MLKKIIALLISLEIIVAITISCSSASNPLDVTQVPYPEIASIIPLKVNSSWTFMHTIHESPKKVSREIYLYIDRVFGLTPDSSLVQITADNSLTKFPLYLYEYEWNSSGSGLLITYQDSGMDTSGIYIYGDYVAEDRQLYSKPILWLKYPASTGDTWVRYSSDTTDTIPYYYEIIDTSATFSIPHISSIEFLSCYLYKETKGERTCYYYYNPEYGSVGYVEYISGVLHRTYYLESYRYDPTFIILE